MARSILRAGRIAGGIIVTVILVCAVGVLTFAQTTSSVPVVISPQEHALLSAIGEQPGTDEALAVQMKLVRLYPAQEQWSMPQCG
jgi:hypothetical protein